MSQPEKTLKDQELLLPEPVYFDQHGVFDGVRRAIRVLRTPDTEPISAESEVLIEAAAPEPEDIEQN